MNLAENRSARSHAHGRRQPRLRSSSNHSVARCPVCQTASWPARYPAAAAQAFMRRVRLKGVHDHCCAVPLLWVTRFCMSMAQSPTPGCSSLTSKVKRQTAAAWRAKGAGLRLRDPRSSRVSPLVAVMISAMAAAVLVRTRDTSSARVRRSSRFVSFREVRMKTRNNAMKPMTAATDPCRSVIHSSVELGKFWEGVTVHKHAVKRRLGSVGSRVERQPPFGVSSEEKHQRRCLAAFSGLLRACRRSQGRRMRLPARLGRCHNGAWRDRGLASRALRRSESQRRPCP